MTILIADDDPQILRALRIILTTKGYRVITAEDGARAMDAAIAGHPDIFLIDLGMPRLDGIALIEAVRGWSQAPILVLSGRTGEADKVRALDVGADDYVTKPFSIEELLARIRVMTRRLPHEADEPVVEFGEVTVDLAAQAVTRTVGGTSRYVRLTPTEWKVLEVLARNPGALVTRRTLLVHIWGTDHVTDTGYLRLYMAQLRRKLEPEPSHPRYLITETGMGYRLVLDGVDPAE
ncbi:DNA-binding response regulator [Acidipropionibacterium jensenii]|uniref:DNA-binding response regulator n=1 Tax=Acidipropionibacterium jensenii TaxID=1749 RepID=A0A3Q9ULQ0_9ACTN|nr:response regulator [Acidipropionibacterium jensenii]AZZ40851.1 DNA-binding response regulator [Acidipropionibacterium jensenii]AZZ43219.1 DNA-binding response regulator [Acidipropionibacterium jensenii]